jgi:5,10-methylenetetrahydrofolate reductase
VRPAGRTYREVKVLYTNITESPRARMAVEPKSVGHQLQDRGIEAIVQITARDRNRIAIQADLLGGILMFGCLSQLNTLQMPRGASR